MSDPVLTVPKVDPSYVGTWDIDPSHTHVGFSVRHLGLSKVRGRFGSFSGSINVAEKLGDSSAEVTIDAESIDTRDPQRDGHLRSADFFDAANHPTLEFRSTEVSGDPDDLKVAGSLTIRGQAVPVVLDATFEGIDNDPWGGTRIAFSASTEIDREAFGLTWNTVLESGGFVVGKKVKIELEIEAVRRSES